jgi:predicted ABC-type ATPase
MIEPGVVVLAGPNGAEKSTAAPVLLRDALGVTEFVDADVIARGLSAFEPEGVAIAAGRLMLCRLRDQARQRATFAFETTLASRTYAPWLMGLKTGGYHVHIVFLWLPSADAAVARVAARVRAGGHDVPEETIRRRYRAGLSNFFRLYCSLADSWRFYDNSAISGPRLLAAGSGQAEHIVTDTQRWTLLKEIHGT